MPTPQVQRQYTRLSAQLQQICVRHKRELPQGTRSVCLTKSSGTHRLEVYDGYGKSLGTFPQSETSTRFAEDLAHTFGNVNFPNPDGILAMI